MIVTWDSREKDNSWLSYCKNYVDVDANIKEGTI